MSFFPPNYSAPKEKLIIVCWHYPTSYYTNQAWTPSGEKWAQLQKIKKQEIPAALSTLFFFFGPVRFNGSPRLSLYFTLLFIFFRGDLLSQAKLQFTTEQSEMGEIVLNNKNIFPLLLWKPIVNHEPEWLWWKTVRAGSVCMWELFWLIIMWSERLVNWNQHEEVFFQSLRGKENAYKVIIQVFHKEQNQQITRDRLCYVTHSLESNWVGLQLNFVQRH